MRKLSGSSLSLILVLVLMLVAIASSLKLEFFASKLLPMLIGGIVLILAVTALAMEIRAGHGAEASANSGERDGGGETSNEASLYLSMAAWIFGFALAIYVVGFMISTPLFVGAYMKRHGAKWFSVIIIALIFTGIVYIVFNFALKADLYKGQLLMWLGV